MMNILPVDVHCHILPGVDDGFKTAEDSLKAISRLSESGCKEVFFTPHINPDIYPESNEETVRAQYDSFIKNIPPELGISTHLAAEYMIVNGFEERASHPETLLTYPDGSILVEMSYYYKSDNLEWTIFELNMAGLKPILAHPERYVYLAGSLNVYEKLKDMGCKFQMNYMSLTGAYGPDSMKILTHLLKHGWYDYIATDLHSLPQFDRIKSIYPRWYVRHLMAKRFPQIVFEKNK